MADSASTPDILNQNEIDALLPSIKAERPMTGGKAARAFEFQKPDFLSTDKLRRLRAKHDELVNTFNSTLSVLLRKEFSLRITRLETITHGKLIDTLAELTHMTLFRFDPLVGTGIIEVTAHLGRTVVTRMLGSNAYVVQADRSFTQIESKLMDQFVDIILREYASLWRVYEQQLTVSLAGHESNPRNLKLGSMDTLMFFFVMEARFGECVGFIRIAVPYAALESLINKMVTDTTTVSAGSTPSVNLQIHEPVLEVPIAVSARWQGLELTIDELQNLQKDDVFMIDENISSKTAIYTGNMLKFLGQIGRKGDRLAVRLTSKV